MFMHLKWAYFVSEEYSDKVYSNQEKPEPEVFL
jgi:hypothetical protein